MNNFSFRLGTTSYIIPDDILPNARYLAGKAKDIELILFEVDDGPNNLPSPEVIGELSQIAKQYDMTYTVHLPLDLKLGEGGSERDQSLAKAKRVMDCTRQLDPWAYVLHLDGRFVRTSTDGDVLARWQDQSVRALEIAAEWAGGMGKLAVENLESYPLDFIDPVLERVAASRCVDIGHLWLDGLDPLPYLQAALPRTRVIHMHGLAERDHRSLAFMPEEKVRAVWDELVRADYKGVLTLEVFSEEDFLSSLDVVRKISQ
ncbi:MAG: sugar phosphate isomerase/epimerase [Chloroflexi bacterium]|nr:sugar phosphate isomerase/epimerase [Chloroflexota bacterium]MBI3338881.1 sugar phosphate isomerase/epimerase [Chloroflexota bacterium]